MQPTHISAKHKVIAVPATTAVRNLFPCAKEITFQGSPHLVVPHKPAETFLLRQLDYDAPAPILHNYDWPGFQKPFDVQKKTCAMMTMNQRAYVLNDMGTGKTRAALWSIDSLMNAGVISKALIVAPLSTLHFTWGREIFQTLAHRKFAVLHGSKARRLELLNDPETELFLINHDGLKVIIEEITARKDIDALCIDELSVYRNGGSDRTKTIRVLAARMKYAWGMTGSPIPNSPTDAWGLASVITPNTVPRYFSRFREALMTRVNQYKWSPKPDAVDQAFAALQPAVRYTLDDVVELPECVERTIDVELGTKQAKIYKQLMDHCHAAVQNQEITAANAGAVMSKLLQVSTGWVYSADKGVVPLDNDKRIEALMGIISDTDKKLLVFVPFKHALKGISEALTREVIEHAVVSGDTPANDRAQIFNLFQNTDKYRVIAAHPQCLAHGITLTAATTIVWFAPVMDLEIFEQANRRIRRVGQKLKQQIIMLQSTPVERRIYSMLQRKQKVQSALLELFEEASQ